MVKGLTMFRNLNLLFFCLLPTYFFLISASYASESQLHHITIDGQTREYSEYKPAGIDSSKPLALVVVLHGGFGSDSQAEKSYGWDELADYQGFIVVYPNGIGRTWNAGACCGAAAKNNVNDIEFLTSVINDLTRNEKIDPKKVYLTGISNGGALAYRYACEGKFSIAAIASVSGGLSSTCETPHALSVMEIHGLDDQHIPIEGGYGSKGFAKVDWLPLSQTLDKFKAVNNCQANTSTTKGEVETSVSSCSFGNEVVLITIKGAGHQWPGGKKKNPFIEKMLGADEPSGALDATSVIWKFFQQHSHL
jgi:polyhydroxybutyrate depolymerase